MTRQEFIKLVKADLKAQLHQCGLLMGLVLVFGWVGVQLVRSGDDRLFRVDSPEMWLLLASALVVSVAAVVGLRLTSSRLLRCPHCQKCIGGISAQVVVGSGRCGLCGEKLIDDSDGN